MKNSAEFARVIRGNFVERATAIKYDNTNENKKENDVNIGQKNPTARGAAVSSTLISHGLVDRVDEKCSIVKGTAFNLLEEDGTKTEITTGKA